jgi:2-polyprenyl-3-methyl-5-hydroxy-6-metoxy-1,4-benzoquinol methylase
MNAHHTAHANCCTSVTASEGTCRVCGFATLRICHLIWRRSIFELQIACTAVPPISISVAAAAFASPARCTMSCVSTRRWMTTSTKGPRLLQAQGLLQRVAAYRSSRRLIDMGAGTGILVEQALSAGYQAEGVEPSRPLFERALARGLPLYHGVLPASGVQGPYEVAMIVDIIEHVEDPVRLLTRVAEILATDGIVVVVTPNIGSLAARLLGRHWWHYRIAHIGFFNRATLALALTLAGLAVVSVSRPAWYFPASYLAERVMVFFPKALRIRPPTFLSRLKVRLNLFDSLTIIARKGSNEVRSAK